MHSLSVRRVFLRTTLSLSLSCYPRIPLWSSRKTASIIFILVDAQAFTLSLFLSSTIHHVGNPIRRFLRSVCVCVCVCRWGTHTFDSRARLENSILGIPGCIFSPPRCEAMHARKSMHRFVCHARVLVHTPSLEGPLLIGFTAFIYVVTRSRKSSPPPASASLFLLSFLFQLLSFFFFYVSIFPSFLSVLPIHRFLLSPPSLPRCPPERDSRKVFNPSRVVTRRRETF